MAYSSSARAATCSSTRSRRIPSPRHAFHRFFGEGRGPLRRHGTIRVSLMPDVVDIRARAEGAMLATAVGDALGWPQEDRSGRVGGRRAVEPRLEFSEWRRREGGRYAAHEEAIGAGEYSDDTQLVLALARALRAGDSWWERLTEVELPFWLFYERGGGAATKRAARSWANGKPPWTDGS